MTETLLAHAAEAATPVTLENVLYALNSLNRPRPSEDDSPWESGHYIRADHLPAFINTIAAAWFKPQEAAAALEAQAAQIAERDAQIEALRAEVGAKQAEIDRLMMEFCPDEMTLAQVADWAINQRMAMNKDDAAMAAKEPR